jgi:hypothetical protein
MRKLILLCTILAACSVGDNELPPDAPPESYHTPPGGTCAPDVPECNEGDGLCVLNYCLARCGNGCPEHYQPTWIPWEGGRACLCVPIVR